MATIDRGEHSSSGIPIKDPAVTHLYYAKQAHVNTSKFAGKVRFLCTKAGCSISSTTLTDQAKHFNKGRYHGNETFDQTKSFPVPYEEWLPDIGLRATAQATSITSYRALRARLPPLGPNKILPITPGWEGFRVRWPPVFIDAGLTGDGSNVQSGTSLRSTAVALQDSTTVFSSRVSAQASIDVERSLGIDLDGPVMLLQQPVQGNLPGIEIDEAEIFTASSPTWSGTTQAYSPNQDSDMVLHDDPSAPKSPSVGTTWEDEIYANVELTHSNDRLRAQNRRLETRLREAEAMWDFHEGSCVAKTEHIAHLVDDRIRLARQTDDLNRACTDLHNTVKELRMERTRLQEEARKAKNEIEQLVEREARREPHDWFWRDILDSYTNNGGDDHEVLQ